MALFSNADGILFNADDTLLTTANGPGNLAFNWGSSSGGDMYLTVNGISNGTIGGIYSGAISVTAVPEPGTWALFATVLTSFLFLPMALTKFPTRATKSRCVAMKPQPVSRRCNSLTVLAVYLRNWPIRISL